jgi:hypothetical protein
MAQGWRAVYPRDGEVEQKDIWHRFAWLHCWRATPRPADSPSSGARDATRRWRPPPLRAASDWGHRRDVGRRAGDAPPSSTTARRERRCGRHPRSRAGVRRGRPTLRHAPSHQRVRNPRTQGRAPQSGASESRLHADGLAGSAVRGPPRRGGRPNLASSRNPLVPRGQHGTRPFARRPADAIGVRAGILPPTSRRAAMPARSAPDSCHSDIPNLPCP